MPRFALIALASLVLAGCQGGDETASPPTSTVTQTTSASDSFGRIPEVVRQVQPSVVTVLTPEAQGSGIVFRSSGYVITNAHVAGDASKVVVVLADGKRLPATVQAKTPLYDVAVLKVDRGGLPKASFASALPPLAASRSRSGTRSASRTPSPRGSSPAFIARFPPVGRRRLLST